MITYQRPSGNLIEVNDTPENRAHAAAAGWVEVKPKAKAKKGTTNERD